MQSEFGLIYQDLEKIALSVDPKLDSPCDYLTH